MAAKLPDEFDAQKKKGSPAPNQYSIPSKMVEK
jgi:hypothetical protein